MQVSITMMLYFVQKINLNWVLTDEDAVAGDQSGENEDDRELVTYYISTNVQFTSSKMSRYINLFLHLLIT